MHEQRQRSSREFRTINKFIFILQPEPTRCRSGKNGSIIFKLNEKFRFQLIACLAVNDVMNFAEKMQNLNITVCWLGLHLCIPAY